MPAKSPSLLVALASLTLFFWTLGNQVGLAQKPYPDDLNIFVRLSKQIVPSVVNIQTLTLSEADGPFNGNEEMFRRFFEEFFQMPPGHPSAPRGDKESEKDGAGPAKPRPLSLGSGFIIDASGLILTNNHVVARADAIKIQFTEDDENPTDGKIIGQDPELDLALIKVETKRKLVPVVLGDSDKVEVGQFVMAVGNPIGHGHSVTHGIISAKGRTAPDFVLAQYLQTDAAINPGNSGGPLVDLNGEVIGINNAIDARAQGIGFAIPINLVKRVLPDLKTKGVVSRGFIGVNVDDLNPDQAKKLGFAEDFKAPIITNVFSGKPADKAGMKTMDVVLEVQGKAVRSSKEMIHEVTKVEVGKKASFKVKRGKEEKTLEIEVIERPTHPSMVSRMRGEDQDGELPDTGLKLSEVEGDGVLVENVIFDSPADRAGITRGDIILEVDKKSLKTVGEFNELLKEKKSYLLRVQRKYKDKIGYQVIVLDLKDSK